MAAFADELAPALSSTLARVQAPPPPPPKGTFADGLAAAFGGGPDIQGAYSTGLDQRSKFNAQSAQTMSALAEADKRRTEAVRQEQINDVSRKAQADPNYVPSVADLLTWSTGAGDFTQGRLRDQEFANRATLTDPAAAPEAQFLAGQGVQGRVMPRIETAGGQNYNLATDPNMQAPTMTPLQEANVAAEVALAGQRDRSPMASGGADGVADADGIGPGGMSYFGRNAPAGQQFFKDPADGAVKLRPLADATAGSMERRFLARVENAARNASADLQTIAQMPLSVSSGVFGIGKGPANQGILAATKDSLRNKLNEEDVQIYNVVMQGLGNAMQTLEGFGLRGSEGMAARFQEQVEIRAGDAELTRLSRLAAARQSVENAVDTVLSQGVASPETQAALAKLKQDLAASIPFSPIDVVMLGRAPGTVTLADIMKQRSATQPGSGQPSAAPQGAVDPRVQQYADQYLGGDVQKATAILRSRGAIP